MALNKMGTCARICVNAQRMRDCVPNVDHTYSKSGLSTSDTHASTTKTKSTARTTRGTATDSIADDDASSDDGDITDEEVEEEVSMSADEDDGGREVGEDGEEGEEGEEDKKNEGAGRLRNEGAQ